MVNYRSVLSNESALSDTDFVHATSPITSNEALRLLGKTAGRLYRPYNWSQTDQQMLNSVTVALDYR